MTAAQAMDNRPTKFSLASTLPASFMIDVRAAAPADSSETRAGKIAVIRIQISPR